MEGIKGKIQKDGRMVIPKKIREAVGLNKGDKLSMEAICNHRIVMKKHKGD